MGRFPRDALIGLFAAAMVSMVANGAHAAAWAAWLAPFLWLWALHRLTPRAGALLGGVGYAAATLVAARGMLPVPGVFYALAATVIGLGALSPYVFHRVLAPRLPAPLYPLVLPTLATALEFLSGHLSPFGSFGAVAYTQVGCLPLLQLAALCGLPGVAFLLYLPAAGLCVTSRDVMAMGVGGLLSESPLRPQPRTTALAEPQVAAIVLCAGQSRRMGATNKLLLPIDNRPLIAHTVDALLSTAVRPIILVTGHDSDAVLTALGDRVHKRGVRVVHNTDYAAGMSTSLRIGLTALAQADAEAGRAGTGPCDGALVCLGDMPHVRPAHIEGLLAAFDPADGREVIVPMYEGRRGNPVLWAARFFPEMQLLTGDTGARSLLQRHTDVLCTVPMADDGVTVDVDTPEAFQTLQAARMPPDAAS